ncbi:hypothetical protein BH09BAC4_BH09BAC4_15420 [soil metagenome]
MNTFSRYFFATILGTTILSSCSRPVAYFQPSAREHFATTQTKTAPIATAETPAPVATEMTAPVAIAAPTEQVAKANVALDQMDALVRNDSKLSADKSVQKRLSRVRTLLASASAKVSLTPTEVSAPRKMNLVERMMLKKMNRKINKQLAPANPERAMAIQPLLVLGAILVIVGLLLLIFGSGTATTIGLIGLLGGAVLLLLGLL